MACIIELGYQINVNDEFLISNFCSQFLLPGFVDSHTHPDHYLIAGTGYDKKLMEWVNDYIVPLEAKFKDVQLAKDVYRKAVVR